MRFNFTTSHVPGKQLVIADLSRAPASLPTEAGQDFFRKQTSLSKRQLKNFPYPKTEEYKQVATYSHSSWADRMKVLPYPKTEEYKQVATYSHSSWPDRMKVLPYPKTEEYK